MINILMAANERVYPGVEVVLWTTMFHNKGINWHIFTMDLSIEDNGKGMYFVGLLPWQKERMEKIVRYLDPTSRITFHDTHDLYMQYFWKNPNEWSPFTPYTMLRLFADIELPYLNHILYLDCDVAVQGDIISMYWEYLQKGAMYCAYVCPDACQYEGEMVAGIMLMDLKRMRETGFLEEARKNLCTHVYRYPDQDAIRDTGIKPYPLPETYSYMEDLEKCHYTPTILHFTNRLTPKIYCEEGATYFYRRYPQFQYVKEGLQLLDTINI